MLVSLHVKNLALIDETEVNFGTGLNIITGETGAGKSIIIGSVNLALGAKADKEMIRTGAEYALIELTFQLEDDVQIMEIVDMDIPVEEDGSIIIQRKIMPGRSVSKVCGETVSTKSLKEMAGVLIDIHGQHEHQSLFHIKKHMEFLDDFAREELAPVKEKLKEQHGNYLRCMKEMDSTSMDESVRNREISLAEFESGEIGAARLRIGEDEGLEAEYRRMLNSRKIIESVSQVYALMADESGESAEELFGRALRELGTVCDYDHILLEMNEALNNIDSLLQDFNRNMSDYIAELDFEEHDFKRVEERLNQINHLKSKYGLEIEEILAYQEAQDKKIKTLKGYEQYKERCAQELDKTHKALRISSDKATAVRRKYAKRLQEEMTKALLDLNFLEVRFEIQVRVKEEEYSVLGNNEVEFMIAANPGEPLKPLSQVASGGELSRIMLALKTVLAEKDQIETLIFDEIDAGISGKTAWKVSEKLGVLGKNHQVICITHLPQIAAMADSHFRIEKSAEKGKTQTSICEIKEEEEIEELSRLLGGEVITEAVRSNAREMKELARNAKQY